MQTLLTFDVGTTSKKCCAFDRSLHLIAISTTEYALNTGTPHIVEANPEIYWNSMFKGFRALETKGICLQEVLSVGISTQGETTVVLDCHGVPLCPAIVWLDDRASQEAVYLREAIGSPHFYRTTGMPEIGGALPLAKLKRLMDDPILRGKIDKILLLEDWLVYRLTGQIVTEQSVICSTGYYDIIRHDYCDEFLALAGASLEQLPPVLPCGSIGGTVTKAASAASGLPEGTPVVLTAMDQTASAIGTGNVRSGIVSETTGTCLTVAATTDEPDFTTNVPLQYYTHYDGRYLAVSFNTTAAIIMKWFKDEFIAPTEACRASGLNPYAYMGILAGSAAPGSDGVTLLPHFAGKAMPDFRPNARGCFYGVSLTTGKSQFIRAIMEGVAFLLRENLESFAAVGIPVHQIRSLGGGSRDALWSKIKASVTGYKLFTAEQEEATSLGAAILSAYALGLAPNVPAVVDRTVMLKASFAPDPALQSLYDDLYQRYLALDHVIGALEI